MSLVANNGTQSVLVNDFPINVYNVIINVIFFTIINVTFIINISYIIYN